MEKKVTKILVIGANGQLGTELVRALRKLHGAEQVIAADLQVEQAYSGEGDYIQLDILNKYLLEAFIKVKNVTEVYALAAILSANGELHIKAAWNLNMQGLLNVLELAAIYQLRVFWPSSVAVFGPTTPKFRSPQHTVTEPATVYGISKLAGELWCQYYFEKLGVDVRSLRYPGLISYTAPPGGGTTDYAVAIFHKALENGSYTCFLKEETRLPMMYMPDAVRAAIELMEAPAEKIGIRTGYNLAAMNFSPREITEEIRKYIPEFTITYQPDYRQAIADSWPPNIDDTMARRNWGWKSEYGLQKMTADMLHHLESVNLKQI